MTSAFLPQARLYDELVSVGALPTEWRPAYWQAPRHRFAPDRAWNPDDELMDATADPSGWLARVYTDDVIAIQYDDTGLDPDQPGRVISSSISRPSIVFMMLDRLDTHPGQRVLEIGTGSGWNAGLLAARFGDAQVVTVEVDLRLAGRARAALADAGMHPTVVAGDGAEGHKPGAPYHRVLSTAAVQTVPHAWVEQTIPGGRIVTPWGTAYDNGALLDLTVGADGTATGRWVDDTIAFMWVRDQRPTRSFDGDDEHADVERVTDLTWEAVRRGTVAGWTIGLRVPACRGLIDRTAGEGWLLDDTTASWAAVDLEPGPDGYRVRQGGPRRLWDEVEAAWRWWDGAGRPGYEEFEVIVGPDGQQVRLGGETVTPVRT